MSVAPRRALQSRNNPSSSSNSSSSSPSAVSRGALAATASFKRAAGSRTVKSTPDHRPAIPIAGPRARPVAAECLAARRAPRQQGSSVEIAWRKSNAKNSLRLTRTYFKFLQLLFWSSFFTIKFEDFNDSKIFHLYFANEYVFACPWFVPLVYMSLNFKIKFQTILTKLRFLGRKGRSKTAKQRPASAPRGTGMRRPKSAVILGSTSSNASCSNPNSLKKNVK